MIPNSVKDQLLALSTAEKSQVINFLSESITHTWHGIENARYLWRRRLYRKYPHPHLGYCSVEKLREQRG
jgi:hypothetical protein